VVENCVFTGLGRGNWTSCVEGLVEGLDWTVNPFEVVSGKLLANFTAINSEKNAKVYCGDPVEPPRGLTCQSATDLSGYSNSTLDLVITGR
jgi:putative DNA methylase